MSFLTAEMTAVLNAWSEKLQSFVLSLIDYLRETCESLVFWFLTNFKDLQDALLAFDQIRSLVLHILASRCHDAVLSSVRSPKCAQASQTLSGSKVVRAPACSLNLLSPAGPLSRSCRTM